MVLSISSTNLENSNLLVVWFTKYAVSVPDVKLTGFRSLSLIKKFKALSTPLYTLIILLFIGGFTVLLISSAYLKWMLVSYLNSVSVSALRLSHLNIFIAN